jgi:rhomboid protease GluP
VPEPVDPQRARGWFSAAARFRHFHAEGAPVTWALIVACVGVHAATGVVDFAAGRTDAWGAVFGARSAATLRAMGARDADAVAHGEPWRLVSAGFVHADASHLFFNGLALVGLGRMAEATFGSLRTLWVFLLAVAGGNVLAQMGDAPMSVGASGGVFGLMGALVAFGRLRGTAMPPPMRAMFGKELWRWIGLNLLIGFLLPFVDNRGHMGGLVTGALAGLVLHDRLTRAARPGRATTTALALGCVGLLAAAARGLAG